MILQIKLLKSCQYGYSLRPTLLSSLNRLFSTQNPKPTDQQLTAKCLVKSCGFSPKKAINIANKDQFLNSSSNPDSVLKFLKENGLTDLHIKAALARDPQLFSLDVGKTLKPLMKFWIEILGSVENLLKLLKKNPDILTSDLVKMVLCNLSFLKENCGLSASQIVQMSCSWLLTENPQKVKEIVERAKSLGISCKSGRFKDALLSSVQNPSKIEKKIELFKSFGWSEQEIQSMIKKQPRLLRNSTEKLNRTVNFLIREVGLDSNFVIRHPVILMLSMDKRLVPRHLIMKILDSLQLPEGKRSFYCAVFLTEKKFVEKFIFPNERVRPGLGEIYASACRVKKKRGFGEKTRLLEKLGFSERQINFMVSKVPNWLPKCEEKMRKLIDFLTNECGLDLCYVASHPRILTCSLERNIIPRHYVMKSLELNGLVKKRSFLNVVKMKERIFLEKYVSPYDDKIPGLVEKYAAFRSGNASVQGEQ